MDSKEIYEVLSDVKERMASVETEVKNLVISNSKIEDVKDIASKARDSASSAHKRVDNIDKWMFAIGSTLILAIISAVLGLVLIG